MSSEVNLGEVIRKLDDVGSGFCLAKWLQVTVHLGIGHTHSCHHPQTHKIPLEEIKIDVSALHNTSHKKDRRREMMNGVRPAECQYCWNVEDLKNSKNYSDRILKSSTPWALPYYDEVLNAGETENIIPKYLEVSFSTVCNFKCSYCSPAISSKWMEEIERYGSYKTSINYNNIQDLIENKRFPIKASEDNPYVDAFWEWFPQIYKKLHTFRITGGEPLLDKNLFRVLDYIIENPNPTLELSINTNLCAPDNLFESFIEKIKIINENKLVERTVLFTSCEAYGKQAEYIRYGLDYHKWIKNCEKYIDEVPACIISVMSTYNNMSVISFKAFLEDCLQLMKRAFWKKLDTKEICEFKIDTPHLSHPKHQSIIILTDEFEKYFREQVSFMKDNFVEDKHHAAGFNFEEIHKVERVKNTYEESLSKNTPHKEILRKDFIIFVDEHDKRRETNFLETFPEMTNFYNFCKSLSK
jgi:organic radical activating enzyme